MKKKIKLNLNNLKVNSFVTSIDPKESGDIKGGTQQSCGQGCRTYEIQACVETRDSPCRITMPVNVCEIMTLNTNCTQTYYEGC